MKQILTIMNYVNGVDDTPFYDSENPIIITEYTYSSQRMGSTSLSATLMFNICLDNFWDGTQYVLFNGEKYFIKNTPSSSKNNEDERYKHSLEFTSERELKLSNVYVYDAVSGQSSTGDKYRSNTSEFSFFGDINEFAQRLQETLKYSNLDYTVVVDEGVQSEATLISVENVTFFELLQSGFETYNVPFYFDGKTIHWGFSKNTISRVFKYGIDNELLSINKNNANYKIINRCTGVGSSNNIPYYYPNSSPKGDIVAVAGENNTGVMQDNITIINNEKFANNFSLGDILTFSGVDFEDNGTTIYHSSEYFGNKNGDYYGEYIYVDDRVGIYQVLTKKINAKSLGEIPVEVTLKMTEIPDGCTGGAAFLTHASLFYNGTFLKNIPYSLKSQSDDIFIYSLGNINIDNLGEYNISIDTRASLEGTATDESDYGAYTVSFDVKEGGWLSNQTQEIINLEDIGLSVSSTPIVGDTISQKKEGYISPCSTLMPPIYRESIGAERFYNALNNTYINPETQETYVFENEYNINNPKEHIETFDDIQPTIKGITNAAGQEIGQFLDIAYDLNDNDEKTADDDSSESYKHPYFFVKLPKFDGDWGFNLFDHAIDSGEMTLSMISGNCGACSFVIGVDDELQKNKVQVDENGDLMRDSDGNVLFGQWQERQNDTINNEVWIALKKDTDTFGVIMPNATNNYKPSAGDKFVILYINLPQAYIDKAENELKEAIIKYMAENNSDKFNFSIDFSRIFLEENVDIFNLLNENASIQIEYNGNILSFYISQYDYKATDDSSLPEISVELADTITINKSTLLQTVSGIQDDLINRMNSIDFFKQGMSYFLRKDIDDMSKGRIRFLNGLLFGQKDSGITIDEQGNSTADVDFLNVKKKAVFNNLTINELKHVGGELIISPASMTCTNVEEFNDYYRCYFNNKGENGEDIFNEFVVNDLARCQSFNERWNQYYWRLVVGVGLNYIDLSKTNADVNSTAPNIGDNIAQLGNIEDTTRQSAQIISCYGENAPSWIMYNGINSYDLTGKNIVGIIFNPETGEPQMYCYGAMFFGDRNINAEDANYITYQQKEGDDKKKLFISADIKLGAGSSGLTNLTEWGEKQEQIDNAQDAANTAQEAANSAQSAVEGIKDFTDEAFADGVIDRSEAAAIEKYKNSVDETRKGVDASYAEVYNNAMLSGTAKTNLASAKTAFDLNYTELISAIDIAITDNVATAEEKAAVDTAFAAFNEAYSVYTQRLEEASDAIRGVINDTANDAQTTANEALEKANAAKDYIDVTLPKELEEINSKLDGVVENWFYPYSPTLENEPAATWIADGTEAIHEGDTFTNTSTEGDDAGKSWRWLKTNDVWGWQRIADTDATKALQMAAAAQDTADQKRRCFVTTPYTPYDVGDMWMPGSGGDIKRCIKSRETGEFTESDWDLASKYTDDSYAKERFAAMAEDGVITKEEKSTLRNTYAQIQKEFASYQSDASTYGVSITALQTAYNNITSYLTGTLAINDDTDTSITTEQRTTFNTYMAAYTTEVSRLSNVIAQKKADEAVEGLEIGGENLFTGTKDFSGALAKNFTVLEDTLNGMPIASCVYPESGYIDMLRWSNLNIDSSQYYILSFYAKASKSTSVGFTSYLYYTSNSSIRVIDTGITSQGITTTATDGSIRVNLDDTWKKYWILWKTVDAVPEGRIDCTISRLSTSTFPDSIGATVYISSIKFEKGNKATDWSPSPEDVQNSIDAVQSNVDTLSQTVTDLDGYIDGAFSDGIIQQSEAIAIEKYLNQVNESWDDIEATYNSVYANSYLTGTPKTNLLNAKTSLGNYKDALISAINTAIADGKATDEEAQAVDTAFANYNSGVASFKTALEAANKAIQDKLKSYSDTAQDAADAAQAAADAAAERLDAWASDGVISPTEKSAVRDEITRIDADKIQINNDYTEYGLGTPTSYNSAYSTYRSQLNSLCASEPENITIPSDFRVNQTDYYSKRTTALNLISTKAKELADAAQGTADDALSAAEAAETAANEAKEDAAAATEELGKINSDSVISPVEKTALTQQLADINSEYTQIIADANKYSVATTAYTTAYTDAKTALTKYTAASPEYINVETDYSDIAAYYTARQTILDAIATAAKEYSEGLVDGIIIGGENLLASTAYKDLSGIEFMPDSTHHPIITDDGLMIDLYATNSTAYKNNGSITSITPYYYTTNNEETTIQDAFSTSFTNISSSLKYAYVYIRVSYSLGQTGRSLPVRFATYDMTRGTVSSRTISYGASSASDVEPTSWSINVPIISTTSPYLWYKMDITYNNGDTGSIPPTCIGSYYAHAFRQICYDNFTAGNPLIFTFFAKTSSGSGTLWVRLNGVSSVEDKELAITSSWQKYTVDFGVIQTIDDNKPSIEIYGSKDFYVKNLMLEYGNKPTEWKESSKDLEKQISNVAYLEKIFPQSNLIADGALIAQMAVVTDKAASEEDAKIVAGINGSDVGKDSSRGKMMFFSGAEGINNGQITNPKTAIYEDGTIETEKLIAKEGTQIGKYVIDSSGLTAETISSQEETIMRLNYLLMEVERTYSYSSYSEHHLSGIYSYAAAVSNEIVGLLASLDYSKTATPKVTIGVKSTVKGPSLSMLGQTILQGAFAFYSESGMFAGFRPMTRFLNGGTTLSKFDHTIHFSATGTSTIYLPSSPENGQEIEIWKASATSLTISGNGKTIMRVGYGDVSSLGTGTDFTGLIKFVFSEQDDKWWGITISKV